MQCTSLKNLGSKLSLAVKIFPENFSYRPLFFEKKYFTFPTVIRISSRQFENFELFCPLGVKPGPHVHIFILSQVSRVRVEMGTKSEKVCVCVCLTMKIFPQNHPRPKKFRKMTKYSFFCKFFTRYD